MEEMASIAPDRFIITIVMYSLAKHLCKILLKALIVKYSFPRVLSIFTIYSVTFNKIITHLINSVTTFFLLFDFIMHKYLFMELISYIASYLHACMVINLHLTINIPYQFSQTS